MAEQATEDIIKKVALRFFRNYYKFRLRDEGQPVIARYDLEGVGGIVADGFYSFKKPDGRPFTATFEATSQTSREEVIYKPLVKVLFWDGLAVAGCSLALLAVLNLQFHFHELDNTKTLERLVLTCLAFSAFFAAFYLPARHFRRYRYIYAIEQFKKYHADEQWIALAHDVFDAKQDKYFRELKQQCVFNGFGLLLVDANLDTKIAITPSRHDIFQGRRRQVALLSQGKVGDLIEKGKFGFWQGIFGKTLPPFLQRDTSILRFRRSFHNQAFVLVLSLTLTVVIFNRESAHPGFRQISPGELREEMSDQASDSRPETAAIADEAALSFLPETERRNGDFWHLGQQDTSEADTQPLATEFFAIYDCARFYNFSGRKYAIEAGSFASAADARLALLDFEQSGLQPFAVRASCFSGNKQEITLFIGELYNSAEEAALALDRLKKMPSAGIDESDWLIRMLEPPSR
jgi:hypothetical protein